MAGTKAKATGECMCAMVRFEMKLPATCCALCPCNARQRSRDAANVRWVDVSPESN